MRERFTEKSRMYRRRIRSGLACAALLCLLTAAALDASRTGGYYVADGQIAAVSPPLDAKSVSRAADRFAYLYDTYLAPNRINAWIAVIPDKSYYLPDAKGRGQMDYATLFEQVYGQMDYAAPIDLTGCLSAASYYATDSHWRQECLLPVAEQIINAMQPENEADPAAPEASAEIQSAEPTKTSADPQTTAPAETDAAAAPSAAGEDSGYETRIAADHFIGSYADAITNAGFWEKHKFASVRPDTIRYLTNEVLEKATVYCYDNDSTAGLYDWDKLDSRNPYDFFLSGPAALMHLKNPASGTDRRLIVFRDSYGSSLLPLLLPYYREILAVDIRYTMSSHLGEFVDFSGWAGADALYLYSTTLLNKSISLR